MKNSAIWLNVALAATVSSALPAMAQSLSGDEAIYALSSHGLKETYYPNGVSVHLFSGQFTGIDCTAIVSTTGGLAVYNYSSRTGSISKSGVGLKNVSREQFRIAHDGIAQCKIDAERIVVFRR
jgi:hypothetical protein